MLGLTVEQSYQMGIWHFQAGRMAEAENRFREVLAANVGHVQSTHMLGLIAWRAGNRQGGRDLLERSLELLPGDATMHLNVGRVYAEGGDLDGAANCLARAVLLDPNLADAHLHLSAVQHAAGHAEAAMGTLMAASRQIPRDANVQFQLGTLMESRGRREEAAAYYRAAVQIAPDFSIAHYQLGNVLRVQGDVAGARRAFETAIQATPDFAMAHNNLGNLLHVEGKDDEALKCYETAVKLDPKTASAHSNIGLIMQGRGTLDVARECFLRAIALAPGMMEARGNLANTLFMMGLPADAVEEYRKVLAVDPSRARTRSALIYTMHMDPRAGAAEIATECRQWNRIHAAGLREARTFKNERTEKRRLKVGYMSADFRAHPVARNMMPVFMHHDKDRFEVFGYGDVVAGDALTEQIVLRCDVYRRIAWKSDEEVAEIIRADGIDILVDLSVHTRGNRLLVFARKPAPVQVTFAGYPGTTGLEAMDYRLSDGYLDPAGMDESVYAEKVHRLKSFWCFDTLGEAMPEVGELPAARARHVTFGSLNAFSKVNDGVLELWARVLAAVEGSRLLVLTGEGSHRARVIEIMKRAGVSAGRIEFVGKKPRREYLELFGRVDIGLDTFPYNGHTTSLESLYMGVPMVTMVGHTGVGRAGLSLLSNVGMGEFVGRTAEEFVGVAVKAAGDLGLLAAVRAGLRRRMEESVLMDGKGFTAGIEEAYRQMWRVFCEGKLD